MSSERKLTKAMEDAAEAHTDLTVFSAVEVLLESSLQTSGCHRSAQAILAICRREIQRQLRLYDKALAAGRAALEGMGG